ncbi:hypothetical protein TcCL_NonESM10484, partial [Trypanosoma cruzi]
FRRPACDFQRHSDDGLDRHRKARQAAGIDRTSRKLSKMMFAKGHAASTPLPGHAGAWKKSWSERLGGEESVPRKNIGAVAPQGGKTPPPKPPLRDKKKRGSSQIPHNANAPGR